MVVRTKRRGPLFYRGKIKEYNHDLRRWLIDFDNDDDDQHMCYDAVVRYADEDANIFPNFRLQTNPIPPPEEAVTHNNEMFVMADKLDWTEIFEETNHPTLPDMTPIPFTGEREEFDVNITEGEMNNMKDSNGTIRFMNVMRWCPTI